jgi:HAMP domain-containing protein
MSTWKYYVYYVLSAVESAVALLIVWFAWRWPEQALRESA